MTKRTPTVADYMTPAPHSVDRKQTLQETHCLMRKHQIRHLPVLDNGRLVGVVSIRDLYLIETLCDVEPLEVTVEEAMTPDPFCVPPEAPLDAVAGEMAERKIGSAVVTQNEKIAGLFTTTDALRALADTIRQTRTSHETRDDARNDGSPESRAAADYAADLAEQHTSMRDAPSVSVNAR